MGMAQNQALMNAQNYMPLMGSDNEMLD